MIKPEDISGMINHWLNTPANGYLGSSYGTNVRDLLQRALSSGVADEFIEKLRTDIPIIGTIDPANIGLYATDDGADKMRIFIDISGVTVEVLNADKG